ncbi:hypothetical protein [Mycobacterium bourgelatii]|uniref:Low molecular weight antigen MTB12 n=1 Tax=Mycobacterium bourgelatii TaxID=1273442 RepID=A0A7I9YSQ3_MYCBU|nr:hypothetical protein [Mycobacterium bourgelatii]MCV6978480.1 hypothetical protein [Mycobacterium bourgelatii]GFG91718.1 low molecular weight antigen MTB12 [Mycobacterium bourgelatii]
MKSLVVAAAAMAAIGVAGAGATAVASASPATYQAPPLSVGAPLPLDPAPIPTPAPAVGLPSAAQLTGILNSLADPGVPFANKSNLVEGGIGGTEARLADHALKKAEKNGSLPLAFGITNIQPAADGTATADVAVSGPKLSPPVIKNVTFVNQGGWVLSRDSAMDLLQAARQ